MANSTIDLDALQHELDFLHRHLGHPEKHRGKIRELCERLTQRAVDHRGTVVTRGSLEHAATSLLPNEAILVRLVDLVPTVFDDGFARSCIVRTVGEWGGADSAAHLADLFHERSGKIKLADAEMLFALHLIGGPIAAECLQQTRDDERFDKEVRDQAAWCFNELAGGGTIDLIYGDMP